MSGRMAGCGDDHDAAVAEYVMVSIEKYGFAVFKRAESGRCVAWILRRCFRKHDCTFCFLYEPCRAGEIVCVGRMIVVIVREREVRDVGRSVADFSQLAAQCFVNSGSRFGCAAGLNQVIRDDAGIPEKRSLRVNDEICRNRHVCGCDASIQEHVGITALQCPAIEYV